MLRVETTYPAGATVEITVHGRVEPGARLAVRVPSWSAASTLAAPGGAVAASADGYAHVDLVEGATYTLELDVSPRWTRGHHKVDAVRGCLALERGPVVYCIEQASLPEGAVVDDLVLTGDAAVEAGPRELHVTVTSAAAESELYPSGAAGSQAPDATTFTVSAIPFSTWGNAAPGAMRVWLPVRT